MKLANSKLYIMLCLLMICFLGGCSNNRNEKEIKFKSGESYEYTNFDLLTDIEGDYKSLELQRDQIEEIIQLFMKFKKKPLDNEDLILYKDSPVEYIIKFNDDEKMEILREKRYTVINFITNDNDIKGTYIGPAKSIDFLKEIINYY